MSGPNPLAISIEPDPARPAQTAVGNPKCHQKTPPAPRRASSDGDPDEPDALLADATPGSPVLELDLEPSFPGRPKLEFEPPARPERSNRPMSLSRSIRSPSAGAAAMPGNGSLRPWPPPTRTDAGSVAAKPF